MGRRTRRCDRRRLRQARRRRVRRHARARRRVVRHRGTAIATAKERGAPIRAAMSNRRFWIGIVCVAAAALAVRVAYIWLARRGLPVGGDSRYYHEGANLLGQGKGFVDPYQYLDAGRTVAAADHPPLYIVYLALFSVV